MFWARHPRQGRRGGPRRLKMSQPPPVAKQFAFATTHEKNEKANNKTSQTKNTGARPKPVADQSVSEFSFKNGTIIATTLMPHATKVKDNHSECQCQGHCRAWCIEKEYRNNKRILRILVFFLWREIGFVAVFGGKSGFVILNFGPNLDHNIILLQWITIEVNFRSCFIWQNDSALGALVFAPNCQTRKQKTKQTKQKQQATRPLWP